ncbi:hypothetical protein N665_0568s0031 [Sinapis alba]|nr:hypothetical protein N665_0568s0031 [Sinapis alba]
MEIFKKAKTVRLRSYHDKYLLADEDSLNQDREGRSMNREGRSMNARWTVEVVEEANVIRLKSCFRMTGKRVTQKLPRRLDSSTEWEPLNGNPLEKVWTVSLRYGGLPLWRNSVTHDIPHMSTTQDWVLWDIDILKSRKKRSPPLKQKLEEETGLNNISICSKNPLNGKLYPLRLHLPPNNTKMHVVLFPSSSKGDDASTS